VYDKMIKLDRMLMIGSAEAKSGKTELACGILRKFSKSNNIIGIKVTTIDKTNERWYCREEDRDVDSSLKGNFCITEETSERSGKDTARICLPCAC